MLNNHELYDKFYRRIKDPNNPEDLVSEVVNKLKFKNIKCRRSSKIKINYK